MLFVKLFYTMSNDFYKFHKTKAVSNSLYTKSVPCSSCQIVSYKLVYAVNIELDIQIIEI